MLFFLYRSYNNLMVKFWCYKFVRLWNYLYSQEKPLYGWLVVTGQFCFVLFFPEKSCIVINFNRHDSRNSRLLIGSHLIIDINCLDLLTCICRFWRSLGINLSCLVLRFTITYHTWWIFIFFFILSFFLNVFSYLQILLLITFFVLWILRGH